MLLIFFIKILWFYNSISYQEKGLQPKAYCGILTIVLKTSSSLSVVNKSFRANSKYSLRLMDDNPKPVPLTGIDVVGS
jgi:hypothetical protein